MSPSTVSVVFHAFTESTASTRQTIKDLRLSHFVSIFPPSFSSCAAVDDAAEQREKSSSMIQSYNSYLQNFIFWKWWNWIGERARGRQKTRKTMKEDTIVLFGMQIQYTYTRAYVSQNQFIYAIHVMHHKQIHIRMCSARGLRRSGIEAKMLIECMSILCIYRAQNAKQGFTAFARLWSITHRLLLQLSSFLPADAAVRPTIFEIEFMSLPHSLDAAAEEYFQMWRPRQIRLCIRARLARGTRHERVRARCTLTPSGCNICYALHAHNKGKR